MYQSYVYAGSDGSQNTSPPNKEATVILPEANKPNNINIISVINIDISYKVYANFFVVLILEKTHPAIRQQSQWQST